MATPDEIQKQLDALTLPDTEGGQLPPALMQGRRPVPAANAADQLRALNQISQTEFPTFGEKVEAVGQGIRMGARESIPLSTGAMLGLRAGTIAAPLLGPAAPLGPPLGFGAGLLGGMAVNYGLGKMFPEEYEEPALREDLVSVREGGRTFGTSIAFSPSIYFIPKFTGNRVSRFISSMGEAARKSPYSFGTAEVIAGMGAGTGAFFAEELFPGQRGVRLGAEIAGGIFAPGRFVVDQVGNVVDWAKNLRNSAGPSAKEGKAAARLYEILDGTGQNIPLLIRRLEEFSPSGATPTAAQKTGNITLSALETSLARTNAEFSGQTVKQGEDSLMAYKLLVQKLREIGTPDALRKAAQVEQDAHTAMLNGRLAAADAAAAAKISKISKDTPAARREIGDLVKTETEIALRQARDMENEFWLEGLRQISPGKRVQGPSKKVPMEGPEAQAIYAKTRKWPMVTLPGSVMIKGAEIKPTNTSRAFLDATLSIADVVYKNTTPKLVKDIIGTFGINDAAVMNYKLGRNTDEFLETGQVPERFVPRLNEMDVGELVNYRSNLLSLARDAAGKGDMGDARFYGVLAEGILKDLETLKAPAFDQARSFSKALNDVFTRTFASEASITGPGAKTVAGKERMPAEILVSKAFGSNADVTAMRMSEIEDAVKFMRTQYDEAVDKFGKRSKQALALKPQADLADLSVVSIRDAQDRVYRLAAAKAIDPVTGRLNPRMLEKFAAENQPMLEKLGIYADLQDAKKAELAFRAIQDENSEINKVIANQSAFAQVLKFENPTTAVTEALSSKFPVKNISNIVKLAGAGGPDAVNGLKSTLFDYAYTKAGGDGRFSIQAFNDALLKPLGPNQPSIVNIMRSQGLITPQEVNNLKRLIIPMMRVEKAMGNKNELNKIMDGAGAVEELAMRIVGANIGTSVSGGGPGSLIAASAGSKYVREIFDKMPNFMVRSVIEKALQDPQMMASLLRRGVGKQQESDYATSLAQMLGRTLATRIPAPLGIYIEDVPKANLIQTGPPRFAPPVRKLPPTVPSKGVPGLFDKKPGAAAPATSGAQSSSSRAMFQSLFPNDAISPMLASQEAAPPVA
jgi:DNA-binding Lrp family transcriptional regulator